MSKFTKNLLTGVIALGLIAPVASSAFTYKPQITANAKRHYRRSHKHHSCWHKGIPKAIVPKHRKYALKSHGHMKAFMSKRAIFILNDGGAAPSNAGEHPRYHYMGHNTYKIKGTGENFTIRKHGSHYSVWSFGHYVGYCYRTLYY